MKLKEAQTLGILALIAVSIILLCMWGGGDSSLESDVQELYEREAGTDPGGQVAGVDPRESAQTLNVLPPADTGGSESATETDVVDRVIEEKGVDSDSFDPRLSTTDQGTQEREVVRQRPRPVIHVVVRGDTLMAISEQHYGTVTKWRAILQANKGIIARPEDLRPGMELKIPPAEQTAVSEAPAATGEPASVTLVARAGENVRRYTAKKGDTLYRIAERFYGSGMDYKKIQAANRFLTDPKDLKPGMELVIP